MLVLALAPVLAPVPVPVLENSVLRGQATIISPIRKRRTTTTRTITLARGSETRPAPAEAPLREIPFYTETMGDLYMKQGHPRLAAEVFRRLCESGTAPRLGEKLAQAESKIREKES